ncbi:MFS transporter [Mangrovactinospora gilvigrisea]|uniref:MFS transporter n=1 Tax=Mangrovactinospora gilvigrisea TaxID=1428644 RepID=A0A1J7C834_9ACTN|nr:MFS transporter [Mangrovactinospora gilvigrisea]
MSLLIVSMDNTVLNIALPSLQRGLHAPMSGLQWTIDAYTLVLASFLLLSGSTADRIGRRRTFQIGLAVFTLASLGCSLAPSLGWLIAARMVQAIGGSMLNPVAMSIITNTFTDPRERARAVGAWGAVVGISMSAGPIIGGLLVESVGWRAIFWINIPIGLAAFVLTRAFVPESRAAHARRPDPVGQILMIAFLASLTFAIIEAPARGLTSPLIAGCVVLAVAALAGFLLYEPRRAEPLVELRFFRSVPFSGATLIAVCGFGATGGFLFLNSLYLQDALGLDPVHAGLYMMPMALMNLVFAPISGRLVGSRGPRLPLITAGIALAAVGIVLAFTYSPSLPTAVLLGCYTVFGVGFGMMNAPITNTAVSGMPRSQAGVAAACASTSRQIGQSLGVAVIGAVMAGAFTAGRATPTFTADSRTAWWIIAGCGLAVLALGTITTGRWARATAARAAGDLDQVQPTKEPVTTR